MIGAGILFVGLAGGVAAYVLEKRHEARDIEGSSTEEIVTTEPEPTVTEEPEEPGEPEQPGEPQEIVWPVYGYTNERLSAPGPARSSTGCRVVGRRRCPAA